MCHPHADKLRVQKPWVNGLFGGSVFDLCSPVRKAFRINRLNSAVAIPLFEARTGARVNGKRRPKCRNLVNRTVKWPDTTDSTTHKNPDKSVWLGSTTWLPHFEALEACLIGMQVCPRCPHLGRGKCAQLCFCPRDCPRDCIVQNVRNFRQSFRHSP